MITKEFFISTLGSVAMHGALLAGTGWYAAAQFAVPIAPTAMEVSLTASPSSSGESGRASSEYGRRTLSRSRPVVSEPPTDAVRQADACPTASVGTRFLRHASSEANPNSPDKKKGSPSKPQPGGDVTSIHIGTLDNTHGACPAVNPPPLYPRAARRQGIEGKLLLSVLINSNGKAENVSVASSSGSSLLDEAAKNGIRRWIFIPASRLGTPVSSEMTIPVIFKLKD